MFLKYNAFFKFYIKYLNLSWSVKYLESKTQTSIWCSTSNWPDGESHIQWEKDCIPRLLGVKMALNIFSRGWCLPVSGEFRYLCFYFSDKTQCLKQIKTLRPKQTELLKSHSSWLLTVSGRHPCACVCRSPQY